VNDSVEAQTKQINDAQDEIDKLEATGDGEEESIKE